MSTEVVSEDYAAYRARMSEKATEYEDFVFDLLRKNGITVVRYVSRRWQYGVGECSGGIEVKFDDRMRDTGNVYIEVAEKASPDENRPYAPAGIYRNDNSWLYVIGDYSEVFLFSKKHLQVVHKKGYMDKYRKQIDTSVGYAIPMRTARFYAAKHWEVTK